MAARPNETRVSERHRWRRGRGRKAPAEAGFKSGARAGGPASARAEATPRALREQVTQVQAHARACPQPAQGVACALDLHRDRRRRADQQPRRARPQGRGHLPETVAREPVRPGRAHDRASALGLPDLSPPAGARSSPTWPASSAPRRAATPFPRSSNRQREGTERLPSSARGPSFRPLGSVECVSALESKPRLDPALTRRAPPP